MKISQTCEYALRAVVWLAGRGDVASTTSDISTATHVPQGYLSKVMQVMARHDLVLTQRGPGGGFILARPPEEISIHDVLSAIDPLKPIEHCPLGIGGHAPGLCPLHTRLQETFAMTEKIYRETRISDLLTDSPDKQCLCVNKP